MALQNRNGPITGWEMMQIAAVQQAISAFEEVIADLDALELAETAEAADQIPTLALQIAILQRCAFVLADAEPVLHIGSRPP